MGLKISSARKTRSVALVSAALAVSLAGQTARADSAEAWGYNVSGQLGNGTTTNSSTPVGVSGLTSGVTAIAGGGSHSLAIQNGAAEAWGFNSRGQLGNGTTINSNTPVAVSGLTSGVTAVAGGAYHSLAIQNGAAKAWGYNYDGELGNGTTTTTFPYGSSTPVAVSGLTSGVTAIAGGFYHSLAIQNGAAKAWGYNDDGELGNGTTTSSSTPVAVSGLTSGVTAVAGGAYHSLAIQNGAAEAWGFNSSGQLGNGTTTNSSTPVAVSGLTSGVTAVAGGFYHSLAIQNGNVYVWGNNGYGQFGNNSTSNSSTPVLALDLGVDLTAVAATDFSSYALAADGSLWVWGFNGSGELGLGDTTNRLTPTHLLAPAGYAFTSIDGDANGDHVVATLAAVPEPTSLSLLGLGGVALLRWRRVG